MARTSEEQNPTSSHRKLLMWRINAALRILRQDGLGRLIKVLFHRWIMPRTDSFARGYYRHRLRAILELRQDRPIVLISTVDWTFPYRQRPQHLALALGQIGRLCFYVSPRSGYDMFYGFKEFSKGVFVTDQDKLLFEVLDRPIVIVLSTDNRIGMSFLNRARERGWTVVYDYIDAIDPAISIVDIPADHMIAHEMLINDNRVCCVASAHTLYEELSQKRSRNYALITNGVNPDDFQVDRILDGLSPNFREIVERGGPIVGYYGALASWFDFPLVYELARSRPDLSVVLIGPDYDGSAKRWLSELDRGGGRLPNLHVLPPVAYENLARHAIWFDVAVVPFLINDVTLATSPLKIFEYMALGSPIVSTPMPECARYQSVLVGERGPCFLERVDEALGLRSDPIYRGLLRREAEENSWLGKTRHLLDLVEGHAGGPSDPARPMAARHPS